jgi:hypothetical protein
MKKIIKNIISGLVIVVVLVGANFLGGHLVGAQAAETTAPNLNLTDPLAGTGVTNVEGLIGKILKPVFGIIGSLALVMFVYGGLTWMISAGNAEKLKKGRDTLLWAAIGLFVVMMSYVLVMITLNTIKGV